MRQFAEKKEEIGLGFTPHFLNLNPLHLSFKQVVSKAPGT